MTVYVGYDRSFEEDGLEVCSVPLAVFTTPELANAWCAAAPLREWMDLVVDGAEIGQPWRRDD